MRSTAPVKTTPTRLSLVATVLLKEQAKSKIEDAGYTNVTEVKKDDNGVWRGNASKSGSATAVSVDFQGNVNTAK